MDEICCNVLWERCVICPFTPGNCSSHPYIDPDEDGDMDLSKANKNKIPILFDANGEPEIPTVTLADGYYSKVVQKTVWAYCVAHIRELSTHSMQYRHLICPYMSQGLFPD
jgi:hypothetical protein